MDQLAEEILHRLRGLTAQPGKNVDFALSKPSGASCMPRLICIDESAGCRRGPFPSSGCVVRKRWGAAGIDQLMARIITVSTGDAGDGWLCPMSSYPHDL